MSQLLLTNLGVVCPSCDELNPTGTTKCASCGANPYGGAAPAKAPAARQPSQPPAQPVVTPATPMMPMAATQRAPSNPAAARTPAQPLAATPRQPTNPSGPAPIPTPVHPMPIPAAARPSGPKVQPPGLASRPAVPGAKVVDVVPPGMRPTTRPLTPATPEQPIPASELTRRPAQPPAAATAATAAQPSKFSLAALAGAQRGQRVRLSTSCQVGRSRGQITFADDPYLSPLHASLNVRDGRLYIKDEGSTSGTFVSVPGQEQIQQNAHFCAGHRLFRFMGLLTPPAAARSGTVTIYGAPLPPGHVVYGVEEILVGNRGGRAVVTGGALLTIGASKCDLTYPADEGLASRHCELSPTPAGALLRDLSGGLGTFVRLGAGERALNPGDKIRIGNQILQVEA